MNSGSVFVLSLITIVMVAQVMKTWIKQRDTKPDSTEELDEALSKVDQLEDRIRVLERIITENKYDLKSEIDSL